MMYVFVYRLMSQLTDVNVQSSVGMSVNKVIV